MTGLFSEREKDQFHALDYRVMKHAFDIHNRMGNYHDEEVYRNELLRRLTTEGISARKEVPLAISFRSFRKVYALDLLLEGSYIYELKAQTKLTNQSRSQLFNYQLIAEKPYGKLINFGGSSVESEFSTCTLTADQRRRFELNCAEWDETILSAEAFLELAHGLFKELGTRLDPALYTDALLALLPSAHETRIKILSGNHIVGSKRVRLAAPDIAFKVTTSKKPAPLRIQFQKFINHTNLDALLWINLNKDQVKCCTLRKNNPVLQ